jgi:hypothetical protein
VRVKRNVPSSNGVSSGLKLINRVAYPKITAFQRRTLSAHGDPEMPSGGSD